MMMTPTPEMNRSSPARTGTAGGTRAGRARAPRWIDADEHRERRRERDELRRARGRELGQRTAADDRDRGERTDARAGATGRRPRTRAPARPTRRARRSAGPAIAAYAIDCGTRIAAPSPPNSSPNTIVDVGMLRRSAVLGGEAHHLEVHGEHLLRVAGIGRPVAVAHHVPGGGAALGEEGVVAARAAHRIVPVDRG